MGVSADIATLELRTVGYDHPDAVALVAAVQRVYVDRYGGADRTPVTPADFAPPHGLFAVGYLDGVPVACGGWRVRRGGDDPVLRDGDVELKRMYTDYGHRGRGFARRMLSELEDRARRAGGRRIVLETGTRQPEAIGLYISAGYHEIHRFGVYRADSKSRCFAKPLL